MTEPIEGVRSAIDADAPAIQRLIDSIYRSYGFRLILDEEPHLREPGPWFRARRGDFWVVEIDGELLATAAVRVTAPDPESRPVGELKCLYVAPAARRRGLGRRLTGMAMDFARRAGCERFILWTDTRFADAHALYRALGFRQRGERELHDSANTREYGFEIDL